MSAYLWRLTDHHAVLYTDDRSILNAALAYSRFPHQDLTRATTYHHGKNNRVFAWQFTFPMAVWNGLVRHLGRAALTFLDEEKPAARKATPPAPEPILSKPQKPATVKPEAPQRVSTSKIAAPQPSAEAAPTQRRSAQLKAGFTSSAVTSGPVQAAVSTAAKLPRLNTSAKPADGNPLKSGATAPIVKEKRAALAPAPAKATEAPAVPGSSSREPVTRKPMPVNRPPVVIVEQERKPVPAPIPKPERRRPLLSEPLPAKRGPRPTVDASPASASVAAREKTPVTAPAPTAAPRVPGAKSAATALAPPASRAQTRVAAAKPSPAIGTRSKGALASPPAALAAKPARATAAPRLAAPAVPAEVTRPARAATPTAGVKRPSAAQGKLLAVSATASPAPPRKQEKVPR